MSMRRAAAAIAQSGAWAPTLSLDDPMNAARPWRWFCAGGWQANAVMYAQAPAPTPVARTPEPEATP